MTESELLAVVAGVRDGHQPATALLELLPETSAAYAGRGAGEAQRRRGWILATFEGAGLPGAALDYVLEELDTANDPYVCAAAAKALRGWPAPEPELARHLMTALDNMKGRDDAVSFDAFRPAPSSWSSGAVTTAVLEILASLRWIRRVPRPVMAALHALAVAPGELSPSVRASLAATLDAVTVEEASSCCHGVAPPIDELRAPGSVELEDQAGGRVALNDFLRGRPTVIGFFYTRCDNPYKCSLTVTKMAQLQQRLVAGGCDHAIQLALISYDPAYDTPPRLARYGAARGFAPNEAHRLFRTVSGHEQLRDAFALRVGYAGSLPNGHGLELHLTGPDGRVVRTWARTSWTVDEVWAAAVELLTHFGAG